MILKAILVWGMIAAAETIHGILRIQFLNRRLGDLRARQVTLLSGSLIILLLAFLLIPWIGVRTLPQCFGIGALWVFLMISYDVSLGRFVFQLSWKRVLADFDPRKGGYLGFGMLVLFIAPLIAARMRGLI